MGKIAVFITDSSKDEEHRYIPCVATEGEKGYRPLSGRGEFSAPWYWGTDREIAQKCADDYNKKLGLTDKEAMMIIIQSMPDN